MRRMLASLLLLAASLAFGDTPGYRQVGAPEFPLNGTVSYVRPSDGYFFFRAAQDGRIWRVERPRGTPQVALGDQVSITDGVWRASYTTRRINQAGVVTTESARDSFRPAPRRLSVSDLYRHPLTDPQATDWWGEWVSVEGEVRDINRRQWFTQIQLGEENLSFQATVRQNINNPLPEDLTIGARVRITGVMLYTAVDDTARHVMVDISDVSVMPLDASGVEVVSRAPFWTPGRIWMLVGGVAVILLILGLVLLVVIYRLRLTMREKALEKMEFEAIRRERLRLSYELHDDFQQLLASCQFKLEAGAEWLGRDDAKAREQIEKVQRWLVVSQDLLRKRLWGMNEDLAAMEGKNKEDPA